MDSGDPRRKEIGAVFGPAEGEPEALRRYGLGKGGFSFKPKKNLAPLQAADMFAWLTYQWLLNECEGKKLNPIATESFKDFYPHRNKTFPILDRLGIPRKKGASGFHTFRHSAASIVNEQTGNLKLAQKFLGHSTIKMTADGSGTRRCNRSRTGNLWRFVPSCSQY